MSLGQQMNNGQGSRARGSMEAGLLRVHTEAELEAERVCNVISSFIYGYSGAHSNTW